MKFTIGFRGSFGKSFHSFHTFFFLSVKWVNWSTWPLNNPPALKSYVPVDLPWARLFARWGAFNFLFVHQLFPSAKNWQVINLIHALHWHFHEMCDNSLWLRLALQPFFSQHLSHIVKGWAERLRLSQIYKGFYWFSNSLSSCFYSFVSKVHYRA